MKTFATIITSGYAAYALALHASIRRFCDVGMYVLCVDRDEDIAEKYALPAGFTVTYVDELHSDDAVRAIDEKYHQQPDELRWSLKPAWLGYLLHSGYQKAIFIDPDLYFYGDPSFLFALLDEGSILLSPHWRCTDPAIDPVNFELNFRDGVYNAGFIGATPEAIPALDWLFTACIYKCVMDYSSGLFSDQKYLDLLHSRFEGVLSLRNKGCNVANWNQVDCKRLLINGQVLINGVEPIVFIHWTKSTMKGIVDGSDALLMPYLQEYIQALQTIEPGMPDFRLTGRAVERGKTSFFKRIVRKLISP